MNQYNYSNNPNSILSKIHIEAKDLEIITDYFEVLPDNKLFTENYMPLMSIRLKTTGMIELIDSIMVNLRDNIEVLSYKVLNSNEHYIQPSISAKIFSSNNTCDIYKYINFNQLINNEFKAIIINVMNQNERIMHSLPIIFGIHNNRKKVIFLDRYFDFFNEPDQSSYPIMASNYLIDNIYKNEIDIYIHNHKILHDLHSCTIFAIASIEKILNNFNILSEIFSSTERIKISPINQCYYFTLPKEIKSFCHSTFELNANVEDLTDQFMLFNQYSSYSGYNKIMPLNFDYEKKNKLINIKLLKQGHKYAKIIIDALTKKSLIIKDFNKNKLKYNPDYWILILNEKNSNSTMIQKIRQLATINRHNLLIDENKENINFDEIKLYDNSDKIQSSIFS